jgi:hypothetical protein
MLSMNGKISNDFNRSSVHPFDELRVDSEALEGGTEGFSAESMINEN